MIPWELSPLKQLTPFSVFLCPYWHASIFAQNNFLFLCKYDKVKDCYFNSKKPAVISVLVHQDRIHYESLFLHWNPVSIAEGTHGNLKINR